MRLETDRLLIRPFTLADLDAAHSVLEGHPDVWRFDPGRRQTRAQRRDELQYRIWQYYRNGFGCMALARKEDGALIGYCGLQLYLWQREGLSTPEMELFYKLGRDFWGQGYAFEAAQAVVHYAFDTLRIPRIVSWSLRENERSVNLLQRLGMQIEPSTDYPDYLIGILPNPGLGNATL